MSDAPPPHKAGDSSPAGAPDPEDPAAKKKGESDPLFNPPGLTRRTTVMGLAPAPHLGGMAGSPGANARAEEAARKQRIMNRLTPSETPAQRSASTGPPPPVSLPQEEIIEPLPPPFTGPPPAKKPGASGTYVGMGPIKSAAAAIQSTVIGPSPMTDKAAIPDAEIEPASLPGGKVPNHGQTTVLMQGKLSPATPHVPLSLPTRQDGTYGSKPPHEGGTERPPAVKAGTGTVMQNPQPGSVPNQRVAHPQSSANMKAALPDSGGWEIAQVSSPTPSAAPQQPPAANRGQKLPSTTMLINPAHLPPQAQAAQAAQQAAQQAAKGLGGTVMQPQRPVIQQEPTRRIEPQRIEQINQSGVPSRAGEHEKGPNTERMMRIPQQGQNMTAPHVQQPVPVPQQQPAPPPTTALALHDPYATPGQIQSPIPPRPQLPSGNLDPRLILITDPDSVRAASFRVLRDGLLNKNLPRVTAVSSAAPNDGKTTCAINLALALAELSNTRVLLIDANFFAYELGRVFAIDRLQPVIPPESWLNPYKLVAVTPTFHVAGVLREGRARFEQHRFEAMIDRLCQANYDYLIVDTPSLLNTPTVATLVSGVDGTILTVRPGGTRGGDVKRAAEQIPPKKALGIALIDTRA